jgi:hypothetical protein
MSLNTRKQQTVLPNVNCIKLLMAAVSQKGAYTGQSLVRRCTKVVGFNLRTPSNSPPNYTQNLFY